MQEGEGEGEEVHEEEEEEAVAAAGVLQARQGHTTLLLTPMAPAVKASRLHLRSGELQSEEEVGQREEEGVAPGEAVVRKELATGRAQTATKGPRPVKSSRHRVDAGNLPAS